jgi:MFS family permease
MNVCQNRCLEKPHLSPTSRPGNQSRRWFVTLAAMSDSSPDLSPGLSPTGRGLSAWRFVVWFGVVALLGDIVYEGARSITGPLLAHLGASALVVGVVTGVGETAALALRLVSGPLVDRSGRFWDWTIAGYALTMLSVPLLGLATSLWVACSLVILERVGKAVRSPAKDTLLSHATAATGRGKGFAVHEALDQIGALIGPLIVAAVLSATGDDYTPALAVLAVPGAGVLVLVIWLRIRVPDPVAYEEGPQPTASRSRRLAPDEVTKLPGVFWAYAAFTALTMAGFATFGVISFHLVTRHLLTPAAVPLLYAAVMVVDAVAALLTGWGYDRFGTRVLLSLPLVAAIVPALAFTTSVSLAVAGALAWGMVLGIQESTLRATVADLIGPRRRATAYGVFGAVVGVAAAAGGTLAGALYDVSIPALVFVSAALQAAALVVLLVTLRTMSVDRRDAPAQQR